MSFPPLEPSSYNNQVEDMESAETNESSDDDYAGCECCCVGFSHHYYNSSDEYGSDYYYDSEDGCGDNCDGCSNCEEEMTPSSIPGSCLYWECCWPDVPLTNSDVTLSPCFIQLPQHVKAIRLGVSSLTYGSQKDINVFCYLNHLEKQMGWVIKAVTCLYEPDNKFVELKTCGKDGHRGKLLSAFVTERPKDEAAITLKFRFYLSNLKSTYDCQLYDVRLGDQLWEAAVNQHMTDVVFLVEDRSFPAHKFLLAARSPVFSVMFGTDMVESRTGRIKVDDADPDTFQQFLRFLYTGQLEEPASEELGIIADKYDVKTLTGMCKSSSYTFGADAEDWFTSVRSAKAAARAADTTRTQFFFAQADNSMVTSFWKSADVSLTDLSWAVCEEGGHSLMASMAIGRFSRCNSGTQPHSFQGNFDLPDQICVVGGLPDKDAFRIVEVFCSSKHYSVDDLADDRYFARMNPSKDQSRSEDAEPAIQKFTATGQDSDIRRIRRYSDVKFEFHVCHSPSVPQFRYAFRDLRLSRNLWKSSVNKEWTDVDFVVEGKTFSAHRALLAARCPALVPPGSNDSSAPVRIDNLKAPAFQKLLYFLYTGRLQTFPPSKRLYEAAVTYQVDLLKRLYEMGQPKPKVADEISPDPADFPME